MRYVNRTLIVSCIFLMLGCQVTGGLHSGDFNKEINLLRSSYCPNVDSCREEILKRNDFVTRYRGQNLSKYEQYQLSNLIRELDELKFEKMSFPRYCSSSKDCESKIQIAETILKNIVPPITNQYPILRDMNMKSMETELKDLHKSKNNFAADDIQKKKPGVKIGMTAKQVIENTSWGKPNKVNRTTNRYGTREQWVYGDGNYLYFENGILTSIQN